MKQVLGLFVVLSLFVACDELRIWDDDDHDSTMVEECGSFENPCEGLVPVEPGKPDRPTIPIPNK